MGWICGTCTRVGTWLTAGRHRSRRTRRVPGLAFCWNDLPITHGRRPYPARLVHRRRRVSRARTPFVDCTRLHHSARFKCRGGFHVRAHAEARRDGHEIRAHIRRCRWWRRQRRRKARHVSRRDRNARRRLKQRTRLRNRRSERPCAGRPPIFRPRWLRRTIACWWRTRRKLNLATRRGHRC
jgi:hypothetical protein